jgi:nicotinate-nucleotide adenylyltransferase
VLPYAFCYNRCMTPRMAILGGTFDPIHLGHLAIAEDVRFALNAEHVLFIPAAQQPFKIGRPMTPAADRLAMTQLATTDNPAFAVSDVEIRRGGVSYTVETLEQLHQEHPLTELYFIVGADAAPDLPKWFKIARLLQICRIVVVRRPGYPLDLETLFAALPPARDRIAVVDGPALDISASELRQRLTSGRPVRYHLPVAVWRYIEEHGLYQDEYRDDATRSVDRDHQ